MAIRFDGRVAIVTGAGNGLGRAHALGLAALGAKVVVNDFGGARDGTGGSLGPADAVVEEIRKAGGEAISDGADVSNFDQVQAMVAKATALWGSVDLLVANAGILRDKSFAKMEPDDFRTGSLLLWIVFLASLLDLFLINNWLPTMIRSAGLPLQTAAIATAFFQIGGIVGALTFGWLIDRFGVYRVMSMGNVLAAIFISSIGLVSGVVWALIPFVFCAGFCVVGGQISLNALASRFYPTHMRSTGVGWALGMGRIGSFAGPVIGGYLLSRQWGTAAILFSAAIPALAGAAAVVCLSLFHHLTSQETDPTSRPDDFKRAKPLKIGGSA